MSLEAPPLGIPRGSLDRVFDALERGGYKPERRADSFMALCPVHEDRTRSLSVKYEAPNERVLVNCHGCDAPFADIAAALNLEQRDFFDREIPKEQRTFGRDRAKKPATRKVTFKAPKKTPPRIAQRDVVDVDLKGATWRQTAVYSYVDAAGTVVQEVRREQCELDGVTHKRFTQRFMSSSGNLVSRKPTGFTPVLYNHADVLQAVANKIPVWLVEGEKDADTAVEHGLVSTTNAQGAGSFPEQLADVLGYGIVHVVADRDLAGYKRAAHLHQLLSEKGCTVRLFLPATTDAKSDLTDHFDAGKSVEDLVEISVDDAAVLITAAEASKTTQLIGTAVDEVVAHLERATDAPDDQHREHARTWAGDAEARFQALDATTGGSGLFAQEYGPEGQGAAATVKAFVDQAARYVVEAHELVGLSVPEKVQRRMARADSNVVDISSGKGGAGQPPAYRGNDFFLGDDGKPNEGTRYAVRQGETVQVKYAQRGEETTVRYIRIMRCWAEVLKSAVEDDGTSNNRSRAPHKITVKFHRWAVNAETQEPIMTPDPKGGRDLPEIDEQIVEFDEDDMRNHAWVEKMPWPGMLESTSRRGKDQAWDAIFQARRAPANNSVVYTTTGWRQSDAGPFFVHAAGAIAHGGQLELDVDLPDLFNVYRLPEPVLDPAVLRRAWATATEPLIDELPPRIIAPLLGVVWGSVFRRIPTVTHLMGARGSFKTAIVRCAMQYVAPELHETGRKQVLSASNKGGTDIGLMRSLQFLRNMPVHIDDLAPDGDAKAAQKRLSNIARVVFNGIERVTGKQRGGINTDAAPEASVITTGELGTSGSAQTRIFTIPVDPGLIRGGADLMEYLEHRDRRDARGVLGAALVHWLAQHRDELLAAEDDDTVTTSRRALEGWWRKRLHDLPHDPGVIGRLAGSAAAATHGVSLMLRMLVDVDAISQERSEALYSWAIDGIAEAIRMQDAGDGDPAQQTLDYLREALSSGMGHFTTADGGCPEQPGGRGWSVKGLNTQWETWVPNGSRLGVIKGEGDSARLLLFPSVVMGAVNAVAQRADETFSETSISVGSSFAAHGWLTPDKAGKHARATRLGTSIVRAWDIPLAAFDGRSGDDGDDTGEQVDPAVPPQLFDDGFTGGVTPATPPTAPEPAPTEPAAPASPPPAAPVRPQQTAPAQPAAAAPAQAVAAPVTTSTPPAAPAAPQRRATTTAPAFRASLAVMDTDGIWLPSGECVQPSHPITHLGDVARVVNQLHLGTQNTWKTEDGQLLVTEAAALELGIPVDKIVGQFDHTKQLRELTENHPFAQKALDAGYQVGNNGKYLNTTTRVWHTEHRDLRGRFVLMSTLKDDFATHITSDNPDPATIARRLQKFADALHTPYAVSASTTGLDLLFQTAKNRQDRELYFTPSRAVEPARIATLEKDIDWQRKPTDAEREHKYLHAFDRGGSYLAGVSGLELGYGMPTVYPEGHPFDKKLPGYWRIVMPPRGEWQTPNPIDPRNPNRDFTGELTWVTTQTLDIATTLGYEPEIAEAILWENHGRIYERWYERVRDARTQLDTADPDDQRARDLVKETYVRSLGLTASFDHHENREGFAPERYHLIQARAKANIIRRIHQIGNATGRWPVAISKDTVIYTSDDPNPATAWPGDPKNYGRGLGQYKYEGSALLNEHLQFLTGEGRYDGKSALTDWTEDR